MIIFINAYKDNKSNRFASFSPVFPPIGLGYLAAIARKKSINFKIFDQQIEKNIKAAIFKAFPESKNSLVFAFSVLTSSFYSAIETANDLKKQYPKSVIVFGGIHPTAMPDEVLQQTAVDYVVRGEGEYTFYSLYNCLKKGIDPTNVPGISFKNKDNTIHNPDNTNMVQDFDIPDFPYDLFQNNPRYDLGVILSSRGCKKHCIFCSHHIISKYQLRYINAETVVRTITMLVEQYHQTHILFLDDNFLEDHERIYILCDLIQKHKLHKKCTFSFQARCDQVNPEMLQILYDTGFRTIFYGIETASPKRLKKINKELSIKDIKNALKHSKNTGFNVQASFIFGFPDETFSERMQTLKFVLNNPIKIAKFNNVVPYPGTALYKYGLKNNTLCFTQNYSNADTLIPLTDGVFTHRKMPLAPKDNNHKALRHFILLCYFLFYFNWKNIKTVTKQNSSSIQWIYLRNNKGKVSISKTFKLINLLFTLFLKFVGVLINPSRQNYFYYHFRKNKF